MERSMKSKKTARGGGSKVCNAEIPLQIPPPPPSIKKKLVRTYRIVIEIDVNCDGDSFSIDNLKTGKVENIRNMTIEEMPNG